MRSFHLAGRRGRRMLMAAAVTTALAVLVGSPRGPDPGAAASPFVAGQRATARTTQAGPVASAFALRATRDRLALGLPGGARASVESVTDRFLSSAYTEVVARDAASTPVSMTRYAADGRMLAAVRFGWHASGSRVLASTAVADARAAADLAAVGLGRATPGTVSRDADAGWIVEWPRSAAGVPVVGDGARVTLFADGTLHALARSERDLATPPAATMPDVMARQAASRQLDAWLTGPLRAQARIADVSLAWVAPNDAFAPAQPDAPAAVLRLAWVVTVRADGALADRFRAVQLYLDAGTGTLLGGDVLR